MKRVHTAARLVRESLFLGRRRGRRMRGKRMARRRPLAALRGSDGVLRAKVQLVAILVAAATGIVLRANFVARAAVVNPRLHALMNRRRGRGGRALARLLARRVSRVRLARRGREVMVLRMARARGARGRIVAVCARRLRRIRGRARRVLLRRAGVRALASARARRRLRPRRRGRAHFDLLHELDDHCVLVQRRPIRQLRVEQLREVAETQKRRQTRQNGRTVRRD